ncbi:hypothetical protein IJT93_05375 [bacterium]|nr:hypothetical protein [bacterium]
MSSQEFLPSQKNSEISDSTLSLFGELDTEARAEAEQTAAEAPLPENEEDGVEELTEYLFSEDRRPDSEAGRFDLEGYASQAGAVLTDPERLHLFRAFADREEEYGFCWPGKRAAACAARAPFKGKLLCRADKSVNYPDSRNLCLEGDPLRSLLSLRERYAGRVRMLYWDLPPDGELMSKDLPPGSAKFSGRDRDKFAFYSQLYSCLTAAGELLEERGIVFLICQDSFLAAAMQICGEVFSGNLLGVFPRLTGKTSKAAVDINKCCDYILAYAKSSAYVLNLPVIDEAGFCLRDEYFSERGFYRLALTLDCSHLEYRPGLDYPLEIEGETFYPGPSYEAYLQRKQGRRERRDWAWRWSRELAEFGLANGFMVVKRSGSRARVYTKTYQRAAIRKTDSGYTVECSPRSRSFSTLDFLDSRFGNGAAKKELERLFPRRIMEYSKPVSLLKELLKLAADPDSTVLDICDRSGVLGQAALELNLSDGGDRHFILCQPDGALPADSPAFRAGLKTRCGLSQERVRRALDRIKEHNNFAEAWSDMGFLVCEVE